MTWDLWLCLCFLVTKTMNSMAWEYFYRRDELEWTFRNNAILTILDFAMISAATLWLMRGFAERN